MLQVVGGADRIRLGLTSILAHHFLLPFGAAVSRMPVAYGKPLFFNMSRTHLMRNFLFQSALLLTLLGVADQARADDPADSCPPPLPSPQPPPVCDPGQYVITRQATSSCPIQCVPADQPPSPPSLSCTSSSKQIVCDAWPRSLEAGLITYSWAFTGKAQSDAPMVSGSPQITGKCTAGSAIVVTVILTSPGYASSSATTNIICKAQ